MSNHPNATRTSGSKTLRLSTIKTRLREVHEGTASYSVGYVNHLKAKIAKNTLARWKREWSNS